MSNIKVFENDNAYFEDNIPKQDDYKMSKDLNPFFKDIVMSIEGFTSDEQLKDYLTHIIENNNLHVFFNIVEREFNQYLNSDLKFDFSTWYNKNHLEFRQHENQIFMSSASYVSMLCYYAFLLYQADHLDDAHVKKMCFQNILGIIKDSCLWDCEPVALNAFEIVLGQIGAKGTYVSTSSVLVNMSICFAWLHEMAHCYLNHETAKNESQSLTMELEADRLAYDIFLSIIEKQKVGKFDGGDFTTSFQEYAYLAPAMFISFLQTVRLVEKILYDKTIESAFFENMIQRKTAIIDRIEDVDFDIDTKLGNELYGGYEESLDAFARALVATEKSGLLEKYKNGGWELIAAQKSLKRKYPKKEEQLFIDSLSDMLVTECSPISQSITGIVVKPTDPLSGTTVKISNIKFNLPDVLKGIITLSIHYQTESALSFLLIVFEFISTIYGKLKTYLSENECKVLLSLKKVADNKKVPISEEDLKQQVMTDYSDTSEGDFYKAMSKLFHLDCIEIVDGKVTLKEIVQVRYDF